MVVGKFKGPDERPFGDFLEVEPNRHETCKRFDVLERRRFKSFQNLGSSSSLHFVEDFHVIRRQSFMVKPQLEAI